MRLLAPRPAPLPDDPFPVRLAPRRAWLALGVALLGLLAIPFEATVYPVVFQFLGRLPLDDYFNTTRQFAGSTGVTLLVLLIWILDAPRRRAVLVLLIALAFSSTANEAIKQITGRARPSRGMMMDASARAKVEAYIAKNPGTPVRAEARDQWMGFRSGRPWAASNYASFPSGHANTAFVFAAFLMVLYPKGRWIWVLLAVGCAVARVRHRRHYPSDVLVGGALGWAMAYWVFSWGWPVRVSERVLAFLGMKTPEAPASCAAAVSGSASVPPPVSVGDAAE